MLPHLLIGQIRFLDKQTSLPVEDVELYDAKGFLLGISNAKGEFTEMPELVTGTEYIGNHIYYDQEKIKKISGAIYLTPNSTLLNNVIVHAKTPNKKTRIILIGYYRSYQTKNNQITHVTDGEIELLLNKKWTKVDQINRLQERNFISRFYEPSYNSKTITNDVIISSPPQIDFDNFDFQTIGKQLDSRHQRRELAKNHFELTIKEIQESKPIVHSYLGFRNTLIISNQVAILDSIQDLRGLSYFRQIRRLQFEHIKTKKLDIYDAITDFFVIDVIESTTPSSYFSRNYSRKKTSFYTNSFWLKAQKSAHYRSYPTSVQQQIDQNLILQKE